MIKQDYRPPVAPLFVPGDRPERFAKAAASGADAVVLDLEDGVAPASRVLARQAVAEHGIDNVPVIIRVNAWASGALEADLAALVDARFDALMLAKAESAADIQRVHRALGRQVPVIALVETGGAYRDLAGLLNAPGVVQAAFGSLDLALDLGCQPSWDALAYCRGSLLLQSRLAGLPAPLDGVATRFDDPELVRQEALKAVGLGFGGKLAIHPRQLAPIKDAFMPDAEAIAWARAVEQVSLSGAAVQVAGEMIDRPLIERARRILSRITGAPEA
ncbi:MULTISPECIES: HpcH/HpaI aldolase/citrate lyase family protein [Pseudomonas]|uniref:HpcH/HpaI aldolase/citrate lyase family protein n=1 Tax=Pseudomonas TaxID=286 RepID=UPI001E4B3AC7|nr:MULTISPECIES: CoA ester lyase [Pseudomonas]EKT4502769.1 CoA ester lyase [Pseudomonas putida]MCK1156654.1 CoA ester lyase [Pseudomonas aeruginosa]MDM3893850.1 CoA ester lyase [Pseudomonas juntendi]